MNRRGPSRRHALEPCGGEVWRGSGAAPSRPDIQSGFTLIELVAVLAILAVVTGLALPILGRSADGLRLRTEGGEGESESDS